MSLTLQTYFINEDQAEKACFHQVLPFARKLWANGADRLICTVISAEDALSDRQRRYYHGVVITEIAQQAKVEGAKHPFKVWKEYFRETYLGSRVETVQNPMTGLYKKVEVRISTEDLNVKEYSDLIEKVTAFAVTDLGVRFSCPSWEEYAP